MLELKNIKKDYPAGEDIVHALKGINIRFREKEFVSILGQSGCGKTTMLNIIGGLDHYSEGDLIINGRSTKKFNDRDWDSYRNHSIGFVFQSYNLIPHQTVLQNVELALTLSGVSKDERRKRAIKALEDVGLGNQIKKRPSQMSGGQMQRVAIARALVNNPDIILADEPTGALDSETSVQVMEILKEVSKTKLVIMVTHNPDLAETYSSRIIRMLDGLVQSDSNPVDEETYIREQENDKKRNELANKEKKPSMSFTTAFKLSLNNLMTKKGRTILTSFAGSIGIIGIALIMSLSQGFTSYINMVQENTLSSYPLQIQSSVTDISSLLETIVGARDRVVEHDKEHVYSNPVVYDLVNAMNDLEATENDLEAFKKYLDAEIHDENSESGLYNAINGIQYSYDLDLSVYTKETDGKIIKSDTNTLFSDLFSGAMGIDNSSMMSNSATTMSSSPMASLFTTNSGSLNTWQELLPANDGTLINDILINQYDVIYGRWPSAYNEIVLVVDSNNEIQDLTLYALGLESKEHMEELMKQALNGEDVKSSNQKLTYEELCRIELKVVPDSYKYVYSEEMGVYSDLSETDAGMKYLYDNGIDLKIVGIIRPNPDAEVYMLSGAIGYTSALTEYIINESNESDALLAQKNDKNIDVISGLPFKVDGQEPTTDEKVTKFKEYIATLSVNDRASMYIDIMSIPTESYLNDTVNQYMANITREQVKEMMVTSYSEEMNMDADKIEEYIDSMDDETLFENIEEVLRQQITEQYAEGVAGQLSFMSNNQLSYALDSVVSTKTAKEMAYYYDTLMPAQYSDSTYEDNLKKLGYIDIEIPSTINIYAATFESKDIIAEAISNYNDNVEEAEKISYTDYVGLMMSSMTTIINTISYVLIAFVAISLVVSSIMIGVITLISVQERTKEIGILRAIGASKKNVSSVFNAETVIVGFSAGCIGVLVTVLLNIPINIVIHELTGVTGLNATLPWAAGVGLIVISVVLTLISGIIPARSAAKKDPVEALRTE